MNQCGICSKEIPFRGGSGLQPKFCGDSCRKVANNNSLQKRKAAFVKCSIEGCDKLANRSTLKLCEMHYGRIRRNGQLDLPSLPDETEHSQGYVLVVAKGHPLSKGQTRHFKHRIIFYDAYGEGPFKCHCCGKQVTWDSLHIDHLNDDKKDNRIENLSPACAVCNMQRGIWKARDKAVKKRGVEFNGQTHTIHGWSKILGIHYAVLGWRQKRGWSVEQMLTTPIGPTGKKTR